MQPLQYDLRSPAAKDNGITHAAVASSNLDAAITMRSAKTELQNTIELRATGSEIVGPKPDGSRRQSEKKTILKHFLKGFLEGKSLAPKWRKKRISCETSSKTLSATPPPAPLATPFTMRERSYSCKSQWNSIDNSSSSTTCNPIYIAGTILQLQITMEFHRQLIQQHHLQSHLHCGNNPAVANHNGILSTTHARKTLDTPFTMRNRSEHDPSMIRTYPTMIRPHTRPSRTRRTAEVDHRGSGTDFVWKNIGFRASAISQNRISCETSSKTLSATPPPAPLATPFTMRERSYSCKSQWNSIGNSSTSTTCNAIYSEGTILELQITMQFHQQLVHQQHLQPHLQCGNDPTVANHNGILSTTHARKTLDTPFTMRNRSEHDPNISAHDPTTHETVSQPSHRRGRSSRFGDGLCMEKHRVSCICYLSKTHFVRDFLQNSIGNSSTSTTCNAIYSEGTILELQITMQFHQQLVHQQHLQPHLHCGNDPTVANYNGILSTTHARKTLDTPFTMRNRSEHDPNISAHDPTTHETVSQPSHRRGRSSRFGNGLCMEKHRVSCICYLSKTHFVRDFLQNSIGNSSTSTTRN